MLIVDLDDTIFQTSSIGMDVFSVAISSLRTSDELIVMGVALDSMIEELWSTPSDYVFRKYEVPHHIVSRFYIDVASIDYKTLDIQPYDDYAILKSLSIDQVLVTTGLRELQWAKINALGIAKDFIQIKIDDPRDDPRIRKIGIFRQILMEARLQPSDIWVIGDNPESELKAAKALGMKTIQRRSQTKASSCYADFEIPSFAELKQLLF